MLSCRLAPESVRPSGVPLASVTMWRLVPGRPRSVGFGPVASPPFWPARWRCPTLPGASPRHQPRSAAPEEGDAAWPTHPPHATQPSGASTSCQSSQAPAAPRAIGCRCAVQTGCPQGLPGQMRVDARPSAWHARQAEAAQPKPNDRQKQEAPCQHNALKRVLSPSLSACCAGRPPHAARASLAPVTSIIAAESAASTLKSSRISPWSQRCLCGRFQAGALTIG